MCVEYVRSVEISEQHFLQLLTLVMAIWFRVLIT